MKVKVYKKVSTLLEYKAAASSSHSQLLFAGGDVLFEDVDVHGTVHLSFDAMEGPHPFAGKTPPDHYADGMLYGTEGEFGVVRLVFGTANHLNVRGSKKLDFGLVRPQDRVPKSVWFV